jgi:hypothetical protein
MLTGVFRGNDSRQTPGVGETADSCDVSTHSRRDQYQLEGVISWWVREKLQESGLACACSITQPLVLRPHAHGQSTSEATAPMWEQSMMPPKYWRGGVCLLKTGLPCDSIPILAILYHMTTYEDASYHNYMQTADSSSVLYFDKRGCRRQ